MAARGMFLSWLMLDGNRIKTHPTDNRAKRRGRKSWVSAYVGGQVHTYIGGGGAEAPARMRLYQAQSVILSLRSARRVCVLLVRAPNPKPTLFYPPK